MFYPNQDIYTCTVRPVPLADTQSTTDPPSCWMVAKKFFYLKALYKSYFPPCWRVWPNSSVVVSSVHNILFQHFRHFVCWDHWQSLCLMVLPCRLYCGQFTINSPPKSVCIIVSSRNVSRSVVQYNVNMIGDLFCLLKHILFMVFWVLPVSLQFWLPVAPMQHAMLYSNDIKKMDLIWIWVLCNMFVLQKYLNFMHFF